MDFLAQIWICWETWSSRKEGSGLKDRRLVCSILRLAGSHDLQDAGVEKLSGRIRNDGVVVVGTDYKMMSKEHAERSLSPRFRATLLLDLNGDNCISPDTPNRNRWSSVDPSQTIR